MKPISPGRSMWVKIKQRAVDVGVEQVRAQPYQAEELLAEERAGGDIGLSLGGDFGLDQRAEVAGRFGGALLDLEPALACQGQGVDEVDRLVESRLPSVRPRSWR